LPYVRFTFDLDRNQAAILTYDTEVTYQKLKDFSVLLNNKAVEFIATHRDIFCPSEMGPIPDIGGLLSLVRATNGHEPDIILGKPSPSLLKKAIEKYGIAKICVVGDRLYTDKALADTVGCDFICVLSGETKRVDIAFDTSRFPAIVVSNFGELEK
jgi:ribonucleotide monophosphatase NagD (HAD superfamily)